MKLRTIIIASLLFIVASFTSQQANAQTEEETLKWLQEQVEKNSRMKFITKNNGKLYCVTNEKKNDYNDKYTQWVAIVDLSQVKKIEIAEDGDIVFRSYFSNDSFWYSPCYVDKTEIIKETTEFSLIEYYCESDLHTITSGKRTYTVLNDLRMPRERTERWVKALTHLAKLHGGCDPNKTNPELF
jgi:Ribonuclease G/E